MKRIFAALSLLFIVALAGCASTSSQVASSVSPTQTAVASLATNTASPSASNMTSPSEAPTASLVAGGTATDFCGAFKELEAIDSNAGDLASVGRQFQAAAADMRKYAPAEIRQAANTYADLMDNIGKAAATGSFDEASLAKAISDGMGGNAKDIATTAQWIAKNCTL